MCIEEVFNYIMMMTSRFEDTKKDERDILVAKKLFCVAWGK